MCLEIPGALEMQISEISIVLASAETVILYYVLIIDWVRTAFDNEIEMRQCLK